MRVLFIDDEKRRMAPVLEELQSAGHEVVFADNVDSALQVMGREHGLFDVVVMDISMPSGEALMKEDTEGGTRTGVVLYKVLRGAHLDQKILIFTNVSDGRVANFFAREDQRYCRFVRKPSVLLFQFVQELEEFVNGRSSPDVIN